MMHPFELFGDTESRWVWRDYLTTPVGDRLAKLLDSLIADRIGDRPISAQAALEQLRGNKVQVAVPEQPFKPAPLKANPSPLQVSKSTNPERSTIPQEKWHCTKTMKGHQGYICDLNFDETGKFLASAAADQTIRIWNMEYRWEVGCLRGHRGIVSNALFLGSQVISSSWDYTVRLWDWRSNTESDRLEERQSWILGLALLDNNHQLATLGADQHIALWDLKTKTFMQSWSANGSHILHADGRSPVVVSANEHDLYFWQNQTPISQLSGHLGKITGFQISPNGKFLVSASEDNTIRVWSVRAQTCDKIYQVEHPIHSLAIFPNKRFFAAGDDQGTLHIWQIGQEQPLTSLSEHDGAIEAIAVSPDSQTIATGGKDKTIKLWQFGIQ